MLSDGHHTASRSACGPEAQETCLSEIHSEYWGAVEGAIVEKWRLLLEDGMTNVHEEQRGGRKIFLTKTERNGKYST
jgi:hypothetical protein